MSQQTFFEQYIETINQGIKNIRKISFKKINVVNDLITRFQTFLSKEVYGRIKPTNYLMLFLIALGSKNSKLYVPMILTIQKLFANNYVSNEQELSGSLQFLKQQHKQFLILPYADYSKKTFHQLYIQTLISLPDKNDLINLMICKNMSLIFRLYQSNLPSNILTTMSDFFVDVILQNKSDQNDKILKSTFLEIVRHAIQSLKEACQKKAHENDQQISIKLICERYGALLADQVAIKLNVEKNYSVKQYQIIPPTNDQQRLSTYKRYQFEQINETNQKNGKFGWCIVCRKSANYYCKTQRIPVCSFQCKQINLLQTQQVQKFCQQETKALQTYTAHVQELCKNFSKYLSHQDIRKRTGFAQMFIHLSSQLRKIGTKSVSPVILNCLQDIFYQCCFNLVMETDAFIACGVVIKKLIPLDIFTPQIQILLHQLAKKLVYFLTPTQIKQQTLKIIRDLIKSQSIFQIFMSIDCNPERRDVIYQIFKNVSNVYIGVPPPQGLASLPPQDPNIRKFCLDILILLQKSIRSIPQHKNLGQQQTKKIQAMKKEKNQLKNAISRFNKASKPIKIVKKLISQKFFKNDPKAIAEFLHIHLKKLSFENIGELIGDIDPLGVNIRDQFIHQMALQGHLIDQGLRILLTHFTIPGQSQIVDRIIDSFSKQYFKQNEGQQVFLNSDAVYSFSYLLMMLQTNLHNPQVIEKMTIDQFRNLSKNMNGPNSEFPLDFLQKIYKSIQKKQLGFHSKRHLIQAVNAYQKNQIKKAQQIHFKQLQRHLAKQYKNLIPQKNNKKIDKYCTKLLVSQLYGPIIDTLSIKLRQSQQKQQLGKNLDLIEQMIRYSLTFNIELLVGLAVKNIWQQLSKTNTIKKYILTQKLYIWVREFSAHIYEQWATIIHSFSMFYRSKSIKKDNNNKNSIMIIVQDKCYLYDSYIDSILSRSGKFNYNNLVCLVDALVDCSKQQIIDSQFTFCLEKIGDVFEYNNSRLNQIVPLTWGKLKQYYIQLGKHKVEKVALFGTDFLKQLVTKFIKKKDLQFYQKQYLKPFQQIFNSNVYLGVKQYIVGGLSYFVNNYFSNIKEGWRIILSILCDSFQEEQDQNVKQKSHSIVKKLYETNFSIIQLDQNYVDYVQILGRMARQKDDVYIKSCLQAIRAIITYYQNKLNINVDVPSAQENTKLDMIFWQTMWLPLLSTIYGICGDFRPSVQNQSIQLLFNILMKYGKLFKYQFWKMIMQGILRPTFQQITFTSQSKPLRKKELQQWLRNSFSRLFGAINKLILEYFDDFKLFLPDILKIYQSCISSNSNKILTQLSTQALTQLLSSVGNQFEDINWRQYLQFVRNVLKKSSPPQIQSLQTWGKLHQGEQQPIYQGKILTMYLILINCQTVLYNFSQKLQQNNLLELREIINQIYHFCHRFNKNIQLRQSLWKNGFYEQMKSLPGLLRQEHQAMKGVCLVKFKLIEKSEMYIDQYAQYAITVLQQYKKSLIIMPPKVLSYQIEERQREGTMLQILITENILKDLQAIGLQKLVQLGYKQILFKYFLQICSQRTFCSKCNFCQYCQNTSQREIKFTQMIKRWLKMLFEHRQTPNK